MTVRVIRAAWVPEAMRRAVFAVVILAALLGGAAPRGAQAAPGDDGDAAAAPVDATSGVEAKVLRILETFRGVSSYRSRNAEVRRIVVLGREAVPTLLEVIGEKPAPGRDWARMMAAGEALSQLATAQDLPVLERLALAGSDPAIVVIGRLHDPAAVDALVACVRARGMSWKLDEALAPHVAESRVVAAVLEWFEAHMTTGDWRVAAASSLLGKSQDPGVVEPLLRALAYAAEPQTVKRLGSALIAHRRKEGVDALVVLVGSSTVGLRQASLSQRVAAAQQLNDIAGRRIFEGSSVVRPGADEENAAALVRAAPLFREWWADVRDTIDLAPPRRATEPRMGARTLVLVTAGGEPVDGATVRILSIGGSTTAGDWLPSDEAVAISRASGVARFDTSRTPICLLATKDERCAFLGNFAGPESPIRLSLEPGTVVHGVLVGPDGKPPARLRMRIRFEGDYEVHHLDVDVADDGSFRAPPLPTARIAAVRSRAWIEVLAPNVAPTQVTLNAATEYPLRIALAAPRPVRGRLVGADRRAVRRAQVTADDREVGALTDVAADGTFELPSLPAGVRRLLIVSESHAARVVRIPAGAGAVELGDVELVAGQALRGSVRDYDGRPIVRAFLALSLPDGTRVATGDVAPDGAFEFSHVGEGARTLDVFVHRVQDAASGRHVSVRVEAGDDPVRVEVPRGVTLRLIDGEGRPVRADEVRVEFLPAGSLGAAEPYTETFSRGSSELPFSELRLSRFPPGTFDVVVSVDGGEPVTVEGVRIDDAGMATVDVPLR